MTAKLIRLLRVFCVLLLCGLAGCSMQDFGSGTVLTDVIDSGEAYTPSSDEDPAIAEAKLAQALLTWQQRVKSGDRAYRLGPDDIIAVTVSSLEQPGEPSILPRTVSNEGTVNLPHIDDVSVNGLTLRELEDRLRNQYGNGFLKDPEVSVSVVEYKSSPVVITGAVRKPGVYYLQNSRSSVLEMLSMAEGLELGYGDELLIFRGKPKPETQGVEAKSDRPAPGTVGVAPANAGTNAVAKAPANAGTNAVATVTDEPEQPAAELEMVTVDLERLIDRGNISLNMMIEGGDVISIPPRKMEYVYVLGYVTRPGAVEIVDGDSIGALQAVAERGGLSSAARADNSMLITQVGGKRRNIPVDLTKIVRGVRPPLDMKQGDILVIGSSAFAKLAEFVKVSAGATVSPTP